MVEKGTMTATFEPTPDVYRLLDGKPTEYVVVNPVVIEAKFGDGEVRRYPQDIRERVTRCRDCMHSTEGGTLCGFFAYQDSAYAPTRPAPVEPDGFCKWGIPREGEV